MTSFCTKYLRKMSSPIVCNNHSDSCGHLIPNSMGQSQGGRTVRPTVLLVVSSAALVLSLLLLLFVLNTSKESVNESLRANTNETLTHSGDICVMCEILPRGLITDSPAYKLAVKVDNEEQVCCVSTAFQLSLLLERAAEIEMQDQKGLPSSCAHYKNPETSSASAHVGMSPPDKESKMKEMSRPEMITFDPTNLDPTLEHIRYINVEKTGFRIMYPGTYFVYSQLQFNHTGMERTIPPQTLHHVLFLSSPNSPKRSGPLMNSDCTLCVGCSDSVTLSGTFELLKDDLLFPTVTDGSLVTYKKEYSFFGVAMLKSMTMTMSTYTASQ